MDDFALPLNLLLPLRVILTPAIHAATSPGRCSRRHTESCFGTCPVPAPYLPRAERCSLQLDRVVLHYENRALSESSTRSLRQMNIRSAVTRNFTWSKKRSSPSHGRTLTNAVH